MQSGRCELLFASASSKLGQFFQISRQNSPSLLKAFRVQATSANRRARVRIREGWLPEVRDPGGPYRGTPISLSDKEVAEADRLADILRSGGWSSANRSLVVREGLSLLFENVAGKDPEAVFRYFLERQAKRANAASKRRT
jgi:hypothetical protein